MLVAVGHRASQFPNRTIPVERTAMPAVPPWLRFCGPGRSRAAFRCPLSHKKEHIRPTRLAAAAALAHWWKMVHPVGYDRSRLKEDLSDGDAVNDGKVCLITGASRGIGLAVAERLAADGHDVLLVARDRQRLNLAKERIAALRAGQVQLFPADLSLLAEVKALAERITSENSRIDILINNHVQIFVHRVVTSEGLEANFALNYLSYYLLSRQLLPWIASGGRVVNVTAEVHRRASLDFEDLQNARDYDGGAAYDRAKLAVMLFTSELAKRVRKGALTVNSVHPGSVDTDALHAYRSIRRGDPRAQPTLKSTAEGAEPVHFLATAPELDEVTGAYFVDNSPTEPSPAAQDSATALRLWEASAGLTGLPLDLQEI